MLIIKIVMAKYFRKCFLLTACFKNGISLNGKLGNFSLKKSQNSQFCSFQLHVV